MKRSGFAWIAAGGFLLQTGAALAQSSLEALEQELNDVKQQHQDATAQNLSNYFAQVDAAMGDSQAALALYEKAGGTMPPPTPVTSQHDVETVSEKAARLAQDQANAVPLGGILELHCGLLHFAALFITSPEQKGLQDDFNVWLQKAALTYPLVISNAAPGGDDPSGGHHGKHGAGVSGPPFSLNDMKGRTMRDSIIGKYLGFKMWGDKEQGAWSVKDIPKLYRANILEPLRVTPTAATLVSWDTYIAMANADEPDADKFTSTTYPVLQFDRSCDAYAVEPSSEKLEGLLQIIKANPTHPQAEDWLVRAKKLLDDYRAKHGGKPVATDSAPPAAPGPATNSNVIVTTEKQGDATIITTHTNSAPVTPAQ